MLIRKYLIIFYVKFETRSVEKKKKTTVVSEGMLYCRNEVVKRLDSQIFYFDASNTKVESFLQVLVKETDNYLKNWLGFCLISKMPSYVEFIC